MDILMVMRKLGKKLKLCFKFSLASPIDRHTISKEGCPLSFGHIVFLV